MSLYLDYAATTPIRKEVLEEMKNSLEYFGNSEAKFYEEAEKAKQLIHISRRRIANCIGCDEDEVVFTSGATESNNFILKGYALSHPKRKTIIISDIEHSSINSTCQFLKQIGYKIKKIPVNRNGEVDLDYLEKAIDKETLLVSIIWVNNEIGTIQPMQKIDEICSRHNVSLHSDATQAIGKIKIDLNNFEALKFLTFSSHKIYGPKGIGAAIVRKTNGCRTELVPLLHGGEQENGYRAGTLSNDLIVGFGKACELIGNEIITNNAQLEKNESAFISKLKDKFGDKLSLNNNFKNRVLGIINCRIKGYDSTILLKTIAPLIGASTGSACSVSKPSQVLKAIGLSESEISESIRFSISPFQKESDFDVIDEL